MPEGHVLFSISHTKMQLAFTSFGASQEPLEASWRRLVSCLCLLEILAASLPQLPIVDVAAIAWK